jgi:hypothetical protein
MPAPSVTSISKFLKCQRLCLPHLADSCTDEDGSFAGISLRANDDKTKRPDARFGDADAGPWRRVSATCVALGISRASLRRGISA